MRPIIATLALVSLLVVCSQPAFAGQRPVTVSVPGIAAIWLAGEPDGSGSWYNWYHDTMGPVLLDLSFLKNRSYLTFQVTGETARDPSYPYVGPDGEAFGYSDPSMINYAQNSPYYLSMNGQLESLVGVFLNSQQVLPPAPTLDFTEPDSITFETLSPQVQQVFFIGDGLTGTGEGAVQYFKVPDGADRLYLGLYDAGNYNNLGSLNVTVNPSLGPRRPKK